jgi:hypothetical protein
LSLGSEGGVAAPTRLSPVEYEQLVGGIREVVHRTVPLNAKVLVVSRGDEELLQLGPRQTFHFPQGDDGRYAGYHPSDSDAAIAMVEQLRESNGAEYLLLPASGFWWLDYYDGFRRHLEQHYQVVESGEHCWIVQLAERAEVDVDTVFTAEAPRPLGIPHPMREVIGALLPEKAIIAYLAVPTADVAGLEGHHPWVVSQRPDAAPSDAIDSLESLARRGVQFIVIPRSAFEWIDDHGELLEHLQTEHRFVTRQERLCEIYEIRPRRTERSQQERENGIASKRSFGEVLRGILFPSRRNGNQP